MGAIRAVLKYSKGDEVPTQQEASLFAQLSSSSKQDLEFFGHTITLAECSYAEELKDFAALVTVR